MIVKEYPWENPPSCSEERFYFDIETTGLSRENHRIILIGLCSLTKSGGRIKQYFAEDPQEEREILQAFMDDIRGFPQSVSFNGTVFDIPFLDAAFRRCGLSFEMPKKDHQDLLVLLRPLKNIWKWESLRLKEVEKQLGISRKDTITGKDSLALYKEYLRDPRPAILHNILLHNYEDVLHLPLLHEKIREKMFKRSHIFTLDGKELRTLLYEASHKGATGRFRFLNLHSDFDLQYFYEDGSALFTDRSFCTFSVLLQKGVGPEGATLHYVECEGQKLPLFLEKEVLEDNLFFLLDRKISEISA